jgi:hypothetical protein
MDSQRAAIVVWMQAEQTQGQIAFGVDIDRQTKPAASVKK